MIHRHAKLICAVGILLLALSVQAEQKYRIHDLGQLEAWALNDIGTVVGRTVQNHASVAVSYKDGQLQRLPVPDSEQGSIAWDVNDHGHIVGAAEGLPFLLDNGRLVDLGDGISGGASGSASGVNNLGQAVGYVDLHGFYHNGSRTHQVAVEGAYSTALGDINDQGVAIGRADFINPNFMSRGFTYDGASVSYLPVPDGSTFFMPTDINNAGQIVGWSLKGTYFLDNGRFAKITSPLNGLTSIAWSMNDQGWVVGTLGYFYVNGHLTSRAFLWRDGLSVDLNELMVDAPDSGWTLTAAYDVNNRGWIVGQGYTGTVGNSHAFLAIPVPEPGYGKLLLTGLMAIGVAVARTRALRSSGRRLAP